MEFDFNSISTGDLCWLVSEKLLPCLVVESLDYDKKFSPKTETESKIDRKLTAFGQKRFLFKIQLLPAKNSILVPDFSVIPYHYTTEVVPGKDSAYNRSLIQAMYISMTWAIPGDLNSDVSSNIGDFTICHDSGSDMTVDLKKDHVNLKLLLPLNPAECGAKGLDLARSAEPLSPKPKLPKLPQFNLLDPLNEANEANACRLAPINPYSREIDSLQEDKESEVFVTTPNLDWQKPLKIIKPPLKSSLYRRATISQSLIDPKLFKDLPPNGDVNLTKYLNTMGISHHINPEIRFHEKSEKTAKNPPPPPFPKLLPPTKVRIGAQVVNLGDWIELADNVIKVDTIAIDKGALMLEGRDINGRAERAALKDIKGRFDPVFENANGHSVVEECNWDLSQIHTVERTVNLSD